MLINQETLQNLLLLNKNILNRGEFLSNIRERVIKLRELMKRKGIDVYVIPSSDYHQSEYVGEHFKPERLSPDLPVLPEQ